MNYLDVTIIIILGASVIYSVIKGFIRDAFSLLAVILGIVAALLFYPAGARMRDDAKAALLGNSLHGLRQGEKSRNVPLDVQCQQVPLRGGDLAARNDLEPVGWRQLGSPEATARIVVVGNGDDV